MMKTFFFFFFQEYSFILSRTSAAYTDLLAFHEFHISRQEHSSCKWDPIGVMLTHADPCGMAAGVTPPRQCQLTWVSRLHSAVKVCLLEQSHTCHHSGLALDVSVVCIHCADPLDLNEFRHVLIFPTRIRVQSGITQRTVWKSMNHLSWYTKRRFEYKLSTWIALMFRSSSLDDAPVWSHNWPPLREDEFLASARALVFFLISVLWAIK